ncbi:MAG: ADP-ribosylglycohydrolase family protein [Bacteriovoracaceae bacterium]|nr:ADP-ribosylglycohydrolase family protein [Bacteriovoracaceae bacterium]
MHLKNDNKLAMLLGLHCGDSLGATLEFCDPRPEDDLHTEIIGGGPLNWEPGAPTDDTDLMLILLESLVLKKGVLNHHHIAKGLIKWLSREPLDVGNTTRSAINRMKEGLPIEQWPDIGEWTQGNGSLMRTAPLALFKVSDETIREQCELTHGHPTCADTDIIFIRTLESALAGNTKQDVYETALKEARRLHNPVLIESLEDIPNQTYESTKTSGFCVHTLNAALFAFIMEDSFEESLIKIVNRGDDADTVGAVTGALCGAFYGFDAIPKRWLNTIQEKENIERLLSL